jgi:ATP-dependent DNA ligase
MRGIGDYFCRIAQSRLPSRSMQRQSGLKAAATFIEPMECEPIAQLHEGPQWVYETKLDGYRAIASPVPAASRIVSPTTSKMERHASPNSLAMSS